MSGSSKLQWSLVSCLLCNSRNFLIQEFAAAASDVATDAGDDADDADTDAGDEADGASGIDAISALMSLVYMFLFSLFFVGISIHKTESGKKQTL